MIIHWQEEKENKTNVFYSLAQGNRAGSSSKMQKSKTKHQKQNLLNIISLIFEIMI